MKCAVYVRVSTEDQASNGVSLADQERRLLAYCEARAWSVFCIYKDKGVSGRQADRPALGELLADVRARRVQAVLVTKLDRLTRSLRDLADLIDLFNRKQVSLVSLGESIDTSNAVGRLLVNVLGAVSQWEAEAAGERTRDALAHKRRQLRPYSPTPYGFRRVEDRLEPDERELAVIRRIHALRRDGLTLRAIASVLNEDKIRTKTGKRWAMEQVRYILKNPLYQPYVRGDEKPITQGG